MSKTLSKEQIIKNKKEFTDLINSIARPGADLTGLLTMLEEGDFFTAPATLNSYENYSGGLCEHAIYRYRRLLRLAEDSDLEILPEKDSILIVGLLADLGKVNYFEPTVRNKKVYSPEGSKKDELGKFDWIPENSFMVKDPEERYVFGTLGQNAERIITDYIPLTTEESVSIIHLHVDYENTTFNPSGVYIRYPLAVLLKCADNLAAFIDTRDDILPF